MNKLNLKTKQTAACNERQEIAKPILANFVFPWFLRFFFFFTLLYIFGVKKHTLFNKCLSQKRQSMKQNFYRIVDIAQNELLYIAVATSYQDTAEIQQ